MSPDGRWVACYHDQGADLDEGTSGGAQSYNEVSFVRLADESHHPMVVGFNPREVQFTGDGTKAVVVSDAYLALIDLSADAPAPQRIHTRMTLTSGLRVAHLKGRPLTHATRPGRFSRLHGDSNDIRPDMDELAAPRWQSWP